MKNKPPDAIRAELLAWDDTCTALGITVRSPSPVLSLCRKLIETGHDPAAPLDAYRGSTLALRVKSIGQAAQLEVNADGTGFWQRAKARAAPPMRSFSEAAE
jgi:fructoselysine-6-P-deglycase FrlB-like protein